ncbi:signal transducer [Lichtheimia corymbifera JMRC:FSU:9682]|uniref:Signal transducer n=1 Tax=Lichtheimia corymbifera JMRC:FSU:9682 TaxID=1263082 RepID=A0A068RMY4_9FUNG|nr:signal transducer [Lichtheimia corymbifera JMRC:FSU:9682]
METYHDESSYIYEEHDDPRCNGCMKPIEDGSVVQFGEGIWHFECFRCAKCHKLVECYSNLLLLRDGSPICEDCSYSCHACRKAIKDEAIMTGEEAYHADCFRCTQCNIKIEDLVFTQTSKGIFCTSCHEMRKQMRQKRKEERLLQQQLLQQQQQLVNDTHPIPRNNAPSHRDQQQKSTLNRGGSLDSHLRPAKERRGGVFDGDPRIDHINHSNASTPIPQSHVSTTKTTILSPQELSELNQMLSISSDTDDAPPENIPSPPRTRGSTSPSSEVTFQSINSNDDIEAVELPASDGNPTQALRIAQLEKELQSTRSQLKEVDTKFSKIKAISRKALDEIHTVKENYDSEVAARQAAESHTARLKAELLVYHQSALFGTSEAMKISREEITQLSQTKADLERTCNDLRAQRDTLVSEISNTTLSHLSSERAYRACQQQLRSIQSDIDAANESYSRLSKSRDDIIAEMIMLNTKNAQLTELNNDLSRRVTEREREALALMAGTNFVTNDNDNNKPKSQHSSQDLSSDIVVSLERKSSDHQNVRKVAQRDSISKADPPKMFKFRRNKGGNVFGRRNHNNTKKSEDETVIGVPYDANSSRPLNPAPPTDGSTQKHKTSSESVKELQDQAMRIRNQGHNFSHTRFLRPNKCEICNEKIWRVSELKCQAMFGNDLADQVRLENGNVPLVVQKCIEAVETRGMDFEGIYRKSGAAGQMKLIQQAFENGDESCNLCDEDQWNDICAITSVLKQYFRDLPNPLFTYEYHSKFMEAAQGAGDQQLGMFQKAIHSLPSENYNTLKYLMNHLDRIQQRHHENLMTTKNLAVIFGPTLMRHRDESRDLVDMNHKINAIEYILRNASSLFIDPSPNQQNRSSPLPTSIRRNSLTAPPTRKQHRREFSTDDILRSIPPALPPRENAGYI